MGIFKEEAINVKCKKLTFIDYFELLISPRLSKLKTF